MPLSADPEGNGLWRTDSLPQCMQTKEGFYQHFLVEVCPNHAYGWYDHTDERRRVTPPYPRGNWDGDDGVGIANSNFLKKGYSFFHSTTVFHLPSDGWYKKDYHADEPISFPPSNTDTHNWLSENPKAILIAFRLPESYEKTPYLGLDPTLPIRGLYFPMQYMDTHYPDMSRLGQVLFYTKKDLDLDEFGRSWSAIKDGKTHTRQLPAQTFGLGYMPYCLIIDYWPVIMSLGIPLPFIGDRGHPCYDYIKIWDPNKVGFNYGWGDRVNKPDNVGQRFCWMDYNISKNMGIQFSFTPVEKSQAVKWVKSLGSEALGFIPFVGPLMAIAWEVAVTSIENPEEFSKLADLSPTAIKGLDIQIKIFAKLFPGAPKAALEYSEPSEDAGASLAASPSVSYANYPESPSIQYRLLADS